MTSKKKIFYLLALFAPFLLTVGKTSHAACGFAKVEIEFPEEDMTEAPFDDLQKAKNLATQRAWEKYIKTLDGENLKAYIKEKSKILGNLNFYILRKEQTEPDFRKDDETVAVKVCLTVDTQRFTTVLKIKPKPSVTLVSVSAIPEWFLQVPKNEYIRNGRVIGELTLFVTGTGRSSNLQLAIDKGVLNAKKSLAGQISSTVQSQMKYLVSELGSAKNKETLSEARQITRNVISEISVAGYRRVKTKVISEKNKYRVFVLLEYPMGRINRLLSKQIENASASGSNLGNSRTFQTFKKTLGTGR